MLEVHALDRRREIRVHQHGLVGIGAGHGIPSTPVDFRIGKVRLVESGADSGSDVETVQDGGGQSIGAGIVVELEVQRLVNVGVNVPQFDDVAGQARHRIAVEVVDQDPGLGVVDVDGEGPCFRGFRFHVQQTVAVGLRGSAVHGGKEASHRHPAVGGQKLPQADVVDVPTGHGVVDRRVAVATVDVVFHHEAELNPLAHVIRQIDGDVRPTVGVVGRDRGPTKGRLGAANALATALNLTLVVPFGVESVSEADVAGVGLVDGDVIESVGTAGVGREEFVVALSNFDVGAVAVVLLRATRALLKVIQRVEGRETEGGAAQSRVNEDGGGEELAVEVVAVVVVAVIVVEGVGTPAHFSGLAACRQDAQRGRNAAMAPCHGAHGRLCAVGEILRRALKVA